MKTNQQYFFLSTFGVRQWIYVENSGNPYFGKLSLLSTFKIGLQNYTLLGALFIFIKHQFCKSTIANQNTPVENYIDLIETLNIDKIMIYIGHPLRDKIEIIKNGEAKKLWFENSAYSRVFASEMKTIFSDKVAIIE